MNDCLKEAREDKGKQQMTDCWLMGGTGGPWADDLVSCGTWRPADG